MIEVAALQKRLPQCAPVANLQSASTLKLKHTGESGGLLEAAIYWTRPACRPRALLRNNALASGAFVRQREWRARIIKAARQTSREARARARVRLIGAPFQSSGGATTFCERL